MFNRFLQRIVQTMTKVTEVVESKSSTKVEEALHHVQSGKVEKQAHPSTTEVVTTDGTEFKRVKTFRYAMLVGYQGKDYFGMQVQKGLDAPTIEGHILKALLSIRWITQLQHDKPFDFFFQRAARTDKAVSAVRQICSMQLPRMDDISVVGASKMNDHLPDDIRVFGFRRATSNFHSQKNCDARTYSYTLPTFTFAKPHEKTDSSFRVTPETIAEINQLLDIYLGTHNFFNYTSKKSYDDRSCFRYILSFKCGEPFMFRDGFREVDVEFVTITVKGQSFILHQIRKMIGMVISVVRELQNKSAIQRTFEKTRMDVPKAPGLGLLLEQLHFLKYDKQFGGKSHEPLSDWGEETEKMIEDFKAKLITREIMETELREQSMMRWLSDLVLHDFSIDSEAEKVEKKGFVTLAAAQAKKAEEETNGEGNKEVKCEATSSMETDTVTPTTDVIPKEEPSDSQTTDERVQTAPSVPVESTVTEEVPVKQETAQ